MLEVIRFRRPEPMYFKFSPKLRWHLILQYLPLISILSLAMLQQDPQIRPRVVSQFIQINSECFASSGQNDYHYFLKIT